MSKGKANEKIKSTHTHKMEQYMLQLPKKLAQEVRKYIANGEASKIEMISGGTHSIASVGCVVVLRGPSDVGMDFFGADDCIHAFVILSCCCCCCVCVQPTTSTSSSW